MARQKKTVTDLQLGGSPLRVRGNEKGQLINVATLDNGANCSSNDVRKTVHDTTFYCKNALVSPWVNINSWMTVCSSSSYSSTHSQCFLLEENIGLGATSVEIQVVETPPIQNKGFSGIFLYAYSDTENYNDEFLVNVADSSKGAICEASKGVSKSRDCNLTLDLISGQFLSHQEWMSNCLGLRCIGVYMLVKFSTAVVPVKYCLGNRQGANKRLFSQVRVDWSSGSSIILDFPKDRHLKCFSYIDEFIEQWINVTVLNIHSDTQKYVGFQAIQVYSTGLIHS
ncbi:DgyrCDS14752 [Dimorphilus gyrociliatus]|uniref:DgyrCDS14752 n=1 Tax=Dimorphilus gyrociliatus TaxID=2664684 RepID=A0A7I8WEV5_9ANNE|nr:DgyrCDS14752 [Dimorphilus gyrociliatus]